MDNNIPLAGKGNRTILDLVNQINVGFSESIILRYCSQQLCMVHCQELKRETIHLLVTPLSSLALQGKFVWLGGINHFHKGEAQAQSNGNVVVLGQKDINAIISYSGRSELTLTYTRYLHAKRSRFIALSLHPPPPSLIMLD